MHFILAIYLIFVKLCADFLELLDFSVAAVSIRTGLGYVNYETFKFAINLLSIDIYCQKLKYIT